MPNIVSFEGQEFRIEGRAWVAVDPDGEDAAARVKLLNEFTAGLPGPGPADGFTTLGRHLAIRVARELRGDIIELDEPEIPPDAAGRVY